jgi:transcriptional regulator with XRE-family HTH domain
MTQKGLGDAIGMAQTWVSKLENPDYGKMTVATLLRLAEAFDTDLEIKFRPFSTTIRDLPRQGPEYFDVPSFDEEFGVDSLSADEIASEISRSRLMGDVSPGQPSQIFGTGAAAAQRGDVVRVPRIPPAMASVSTIQERLYGNC